MFFLKCKRHFDDLISIRNIVVPVQIVKQFGRYHQAKKQYECTKI